MKQYLFIIDTADYAGNFERELCAYITGRIGGCGVGDDMAGLFLKEMGLEQFENVIEQPDDHGCWRPTSICEDNPNSVEIYFGEKPTKEQIELMKERAQKFAQMPDKWTQKSNISKILGFRLVHRDTKPTILSEENV